MKLILISAMLLSLVSCASSKKSRGPASMQGCQVQKHYKKNWFRVAKDGQAVPEYNSWYTESQANKHLSMLKQKGFCK